MAANADARAKVAAKIRALLAKTVENGCSKEEALSAARVAADLLARHEMDLGEAELHATPYGEREVVEPDAVGDRLWRVAFAIAKLTSCTWWQTGPGVTPVRVTFLGLEHEVEIAGYLMAICARAMRDALAAVDRDVAILKPEFRRRRRNAFLDGMSETLRDRILEMVPPRPAGTGLVVLRSEMLKEEMKRRGIDITNLRTSPGRDFDPGYDGGREAGERVALDPGLRGPSRETPLVEAR